MKTLTVLITAAALAASPGALAQSCDAMTERAQASAQAKVERIEAAVAEELDRISERTEARWEDMQAQVAAGEMDAQQAEQAFAELEEQAQAENAAVQAWAEEQFETVRQETEAEMARGMENCRQ